MYWQLDELTSAQNWSCHTQGWSTIIWMWQLCFAPGHCSVISFIHRDWCTHAFRWRTRSLLGSESFSLLLFIVKTTFLFWLPFPRVAWMSQWGKMAHTCTMQLICRSREEKREDFRFLVSVAVSEKATKLCGKNAPILSVKKMKRISSWDQTLTIHVASLQCLLKAWIPVFGQERKVASYTGHK